MRSSHFKLKIARNELFVENLFFDSNWDSSKFIEDNHKDVAVNGGALFGFMEMPKIRNCLSHIDVSKNFPTRGVESPPRLVVWKIKSCDFFDLLIVAKHLGFPSPNSFVVKNKDSSKIFQILIKLSQVSEFTIVQIHEAFLNFRYLNSGYLPQDEGNELSVENMRLFGSEVSQTSKGFSIGVERVEREAENGSDVETEVRSWDIGNSLSGGN